MDCKTCKARFRADHLEERAPGLECPRKPSKLPGEGPDCELTPARDFNLMLKTTIGAVEETGSVAYLRPETAQGIFINFKNALQSLRVKPPFGIAQIGKSFRNEITTKNFVFRMREFEQMECEFFVPPAEAGSGTRAGRPSASTGTSASASAPTTCACASTTPTSSPTTRARPPTSSTASRWAGPSSRGSPTAGPSTSPSTPTHSGEKLEYFDQPTGERYVPHVIEPAAGADRAMLAFLADAYDEDEIGGERRTVLKLHPRLALL